MRHTSLLLTCCLFLVTPAASHVGPENSVVKVLATQRLPNPLQPWATGNPNEVTGSGTVIAGQHILTNAHLVLYATAIAIQPYRGGDKFEAKGEMIAPDMDLAVLSVKDTKTTTLT